MPGTGERRDAGDGRSDFEIMQKWIDFDKNSDDFPLFVLKASLLVQSQKAVDELLQPPV